MLTDEQKIDTLYKYYKKDQLSKKQIKRVLSWANDKNTLVRIEVAKCLFQESPETAKVLFRLGKDKDWFVRTTAYITLRGYSAKNVEVFLKKAMNREYHVTPTVCAISAWSGVAANRGDNLDKKLKYIKRFEKKRRIRRSSRCRQECRSARYLLGERSVLDEILQRQIHHPNIDVRCLVLYDLEYICNFYENCDRQDKERIIQCMKKAVKDPSKSVVSVAEECLNSVLGEGE